MIELINVTKKFGDFVAIEDTSLIFDEGKIYGIIGTNGAGKSTFLRLLSGVYSPEAGEILYDSEKVFNNSKVKKDICFVPDELYFEENSNLFIMAKRYKLIYPQFSQEKFDKLVEEFKLDKKKTFKTFSKGMRKLAAIILALSSGAKYLYFDEAYDGLDPFVRKRIKDIIFSEVCDEKIVIITSHSILEVEDMCDSFLLLNDRRVILTGSVNEIQESIFKIEIAGGEKISQEDFGNFKVIYFKQDKDITNLVIKGDYDEIEKLVNGYCPVYSNIAQLSLTEIMTIAVNNDRGNLI